MTRCVEDELSEVVENSVPNVEVLLAAWDTLGIAVSENSKFNLPLSQFLKALLNVLKMT